MKVKCYSCGAVINMDDLKEVRSVHDWCNDCSRIRKDVDFCMGCMDKSLQQIVIPAPVGYSEAKEVN